MTISRIRWAVALGAVLALQGSGGHAGEVTWHAVAAPPAPVAVLASTSASAPVSAPQFPAVTLGRPVALASSPANGSVIAQAAVAPPGCQPLSPAPGRSSRVPYVARAQAPPPDPPPPVSGPPPVPPPAPAPPNTGEFNTGVAIDRPLGHPFMERWRHLFPTGDHVSASGREPLQSDHCFDYLASPVTNPFFFEDPRSLTELRPIFIYQSAPNRNAIFHGGHSEFFGTQARLALTEKWSLVVNELGFVSLHPDNPVDDVQRGTGFAEVHLGPKYTFWRSDCSRTVAAAGLTFELPTGARREFQDTGNLGLDPYLSLAHSFRLPAGYGSLNFMGTTGYSFALDSKRSEFLHNSLHLDYNIANTNFYPLLEANWFHYTKAGRNTDLGFEGADLVNFGSRSLGGRDFFTLAAGLRYKFTENFQTGLAAEFPLSHQEDLTSFRLTLDFIFRY